MKNKALVVFLGALVLLFGSFPAGAEESAEKASTVTLQTRYIPESDVAANTDGIAIGESKFEFEHEFKVQELPMIFAIDYQHADIIENMPLVLPTHLEGVSARIGAKFPAPFIADERYFMGVDIFPSMYTDDGQFTSSAFRIPFRTYLIYKESESFILVGGIKVRPAYDTAVLPVLGFIYKPNDRLSFNMASDDPHIAYKLNDKATAVAEFGFVADEYEVTRGGQEGVVLKYNEYSAGAGLRYDLTENIQAGVSVGGVFGRRIEYRDEVGKAVPDAGMYTSVRLTGKF